MEKKKRTQYSVGALNKAVEAIQSGMPFKTASKIYKIPRSTLQDKVKGRTSLEKKCGPETVLTKEEENLLVAWLFRIAHCGFPATKEQLLESVQLLVKELDRPNNFTDGKPGRKWYELFLKRHPELSTRISQNLTCARNSLTENRILQWFIEVGTYLESTDNLDVTFDPSRVFNCDETAFFLSPKGGKVLVRKGDRTVYSFVSNDDKECLTTLVTCSASGQILLLMIVFNYKRIPKSVAEKVPKHWGIGKSENGWMTGETFYEYIANIFHPWLVAQNVQFPVILFLDGHTSHLTMALSEFCIESKIILIALCPNATHILQPLDVTVFRPLKLEWKKSVNSWRMENNGQKITKDSFAPILESMIRKITNIPDIIKNGFRTCGLVPFNVENIKFSKYFKTEVREQGLEKAQGLEKQEQPIKTQADLICLEQNISEDTLTLFHKSGPVWEGPVEHTSLFTLWKKMKNRTVNNNNNEIEITDQEVQGHDLQEDSNMEEMSTDLKNCNEGAAPKIVQTDRLITDHLHVDDEPQDDLNAKDIFVRADIENENEIEVTGFIDSTNVFLTVGIPEDIPIMMVNTPDKAHHVDAVGTYKVVDISQQHFQLTELNSENNNVQLDQNILDLNPVTEMNVTKEFISENSSDEPTTETGSKNDTNSNILEKKMSPLQENVTDTSVPTPFKKTLFWPTPKENISKRKLKDKVPAVASSFQWQQYYKKKEEKKKQEEQQKMQRKENRTKKKETAVEIKKKKAEIAVSERINKRISNRRVSNRKIQKVPKDLFSMKENNEPSTSKADAHQESWYCALCDTEDQLDMRLCSYCLKYYHECCLGLTEDDTCELRCPFC